MILKRARLHNYAQHRDLDVRFNGTMTAIVGRNGSGKSNFLGAIQFGFTGEQPDKNKADLLSWGADTGSVLLEFEHAGAQCEILRAVHSPDVTFRYGDQQFSGARKVQEAIKELLALDRDLVRQAIFVRQAEIDAILFQDPRVRELAFQRLLGIGDAAKIHKVMGEFLSGVQEPQNYDDQIAQGQVSQQEMTGRLVALQAQQEGLSTLLESQPSSRDLVGAQASALATKTSCSNLLSAKTRLSEAESRMKTADAALKACPRDETGIAALDAELQRLAAVGTAIQRYREAKATWEACGMTLVNLGSAPYAPEAIKAAYDQYQEAEGQRNRLQGQHKLHADLRRAISGAEGVQNCPVCGADIQDVKVLQARLEGILTGISDNLVKLGDESSRAKAQYGTMDTAARDFQTRYSQGLARYQAADDSLKGLQEPQESPEAVAGMVTTLRAQKTAALAARERLVRLETQYSVETANVGRLTREYGSLLEGCRAALGRDPETLVQADIDELDRKVIDIDKILQDRQELEKGLARMSGMTQELAAAIAALSRTLEDLKAKREGQSGRREAIETLTKVRDWFSWQNGPHALSVSVLSSLTDDVNGFLGQFTSPFMVESSDESLGFKVRFTDGRQVPESGLPDASVLSGGQRIQLSISFRLAAYCMFCGKLGLLAMDEPGAYLDAANMGRLGEVFGRVKKIASGMNLQLLVCTHDEGFLGYADTVVDLSGA